MSQYPAIFELSSLDGTNGFRIDGVAAYDASQNYGSPAGRAGDVNGDGFADLILGASRADPHGSGSGAGYVVFGSASGFGATFELANLDGDNGFKLSGKSVYLYTGRSVSSAGDLNGDGVDDIIVGANQGGTLPGSGESYVVFGSKSGFAANLDLSSLDGSNGFMLLGAHKYDDSGNSVSSAGDVNGDGFDDLLIGADGHDTATGEAFIVFGHAGAFAAQVRLADLNGTDGFSLTGEQQWSFTASRAVGAGDVNGDGFNDVIIGSSLLNTTVDDAGAAYVVFGKASEFSAQMDLSSLDGTNGFRIDGLQSVDSLGRAVASAGDVNADGYDDVIIGAAGFNSGQSGAGASYVVFGKASGFPAHLSVSDLNGTNGFRISGAASGDQSGYSVAGAGDVNGDGFDDVIVSSWSVDPNGADSGSSYVVFGKASGFTADISLGSLDGSNGYRLDGVAAGDRTGFAVAAAGDLNRDGLGDIIITANGADPNGEQSGAFYVVYGRLPDTVVNRTGTDASQSLVGGDFNDVLSGLGGADTLWGHGGADSLAGGQGDDILIGGAGNDVLDGGVGSDTVSYLDAAAGVKVDLSVAGPQNTHGGGRDSIVNVESLVGSAFHDKLEGDGHNNGLQGGAGADVLRGGDGNDHLDGGAGRDVLSGGLGKDVFEFSALGDSTKSAPDLISDFATGDKIDLSAIDANAAAAGDQAFHLGGGGHAGDIVATYDAHHDRTTVDLYVDNNASVDARILLSGDHAGLSAADFIL